MQQPVTQLQMHASRARCNDWGGGRASSKQCCHGKEGCAGRRPLAVGLSSVIIRPALPIGVPSPSIASIGLPIPPAPVAGALVVSWQHLKTS